MKSLDLYIDADRRSLVSREGHNTNLFPVWYRGDRFLLRLHYLDVTAPGQDGGVAAHPLPLTSTWKLGGKKQAGDDPLLFFSDTDQWNIDSDWAEMDPAQGKLSCRVSLNTELLTAHLEGKAQDDIRVDIKETDPAGNPFTIQFQIRLVNDVIREGYDTPEPLADAGQQWVTASDGKRRLAHYFAEDDTWRVMLPVLVDGHPTFTWEDVAE